MFYNVLASHIFAHSIIQVTSVVKYNYLLVIKTLDARECHGTHEIYKI